MVVTNHAMCAVDTLCRPQPSDFNRHCVFVFVCLLEYVIKSAIESSARKFYLLAAMSVALANRLTDKLEVELHAREIPAPAES